MFAPHESSILGERRSPQGWVLAVTPNDRKIMMGHLRTAVVEKGGQLLDLGHVVFGVDGRLQDQTGQIFGMPLG